MIHLISTKLSGFNAVAVLFLLTGSCGGSILEGQSELIGPRQPIVATVGNDIILPCNLKPAEDAFPIAFEWTRPDMQPRFVHVWRSGQNLEGIQHEFYEGRTSVFIDKLKHGDISLKLSKVKLSDEGKYRCFIPEWKKESFVVLVVDDFFTDPSDSGSTAYIIIGLVVGVLVILAVALAAWKWRQNKIKTKKQQEDEETQRGGEKNSTSNDSEQEGLLERETDSKQSKKERQIINNQNTMEDKNNLARLGEGTKLSYQTEEETHQEKTEGETSNILIQGQEESESITVEIAAPGPAEVETQKEQAGRTESVNTETATQSLMDGHGQEQQVRAAADTNNETEKEEKEEDIKSTKDEASSQGPTDDKRQHTDPTAGGGVMNDSDQTGGQAGRSDDPPVPAERKQQQVRAAGESSNDTNTVENKDLTQTTEKEAAAQGPTDDKTQPSDPPAGGGRQNDSELITGQKDTPCTAESGHKVENGDRRDGEGNPTLLPPVKPDRLSKSEQQKDLNKLVRQEASNDTKKVENKIQTQTKDDNAAAQGPTDDTTQPSDPPAGGETKITEEKDALCPAERRQKVKNGDRERDRGGSPTPLPPVKPDRLSKSEQKDLDKKNKDNKTESTNNKAAGPSEGETQQNDQPAVGGTMNESDQTGGPTGKSDDTPVPAERKRQKEQQEERRKSLMEGDGQQQLVGQEASNDTKTVENKI
ncbi:protein IWS1 homolog A-like [Sander lucioperca]|uniref:protein IWS1 homolog A-like n=1 Tax=Sander lucioperca TaxID=283035 RepID=UPI00165390CF|nr:protein IWS1 homolog A-like [Sander lucioperca]